MNDALATVWRHVDAVLVRVAAEIARESRPDLGAESLAKERGYRNPTQLIAATLGGTVGEATQLVAVGEATAPRMTFSGHSAPAKHPHVAAVLKAGRIGSRQSGMIVAMLDRVAVRAGHAAVDLAERTLAEQAPGLTLDQLAKVISRAEAHLDPDGLELNEHERRGETTVSMFERDGMLHLNGKWEIALGAPIKTAIDGIVTADFRRNEPGGPDMEERTVGRRRADALSQLAAHALGCTHSDLPLEDTTVVVRVTLDDLRGGTGTATIDGMAQPISIGSARRMASAAGVIPCVLGSDSEILDWGREKRLFTKVQKLALAERDGGCSMCGMDPGKTKAHHLMRWTRDAGPTDLANGVLLCESCHHRVHDNGWHIRIDGNGTGAKVWFIPPPDVDSDRTPRLGGRNRFDYVPPRDQTALLESLTRQGKWPVALKRTVGDPEAAVRHSARESSQSAGEDHLFLVEQMYTQAVS